MKTTTPPPKNLLLYTLFHRLHVRILILVLTLIASVLGLASPYFQKEFVDGLVGYQSELPFHLQAFDSPFMLIFLGFVTLLLAQGISQLANYIAFRESIFLQRDFGEILYRKTLGLRTDTLSTRPVGEVVSLYATDVPGATILIEQSLPVGAAIVFPLALVPAVLIYFYKVPALPTLASLLALIALNSVMALRQSVFFTRFKQLAAERTGLVSEWVQNIRALRILGWITQFEKKIFKKRIEETSNRILMVTNGQAMNSISSCITFLINVIVIYSLMSLTEGGVTPGKLLSVMWIVGVYLTRPCRQMPWFFTFVFDGLTSLKRLTDYLEITNQDSTHDSTLAPSDSGKKPLSSQAMALHVDHLNLDIGTHTILRDIEFSVAEGEFVAVVGEVGSGKSLLLLSLLGETAASFAQYNVQKQDALKLSNEELRKHFCFVSQEGFVMSASLRENIAFTYEFPDTCDAGILQSLKNAQFEIGKEGGNKGLETEIGERGVNLSGGQRQRVSLARADFHASSILLLDDCLSAVDVDTEKSLMKSLFFGSWKDRTRILVTHRLSVLPHVDRILFLKDGKLIADGSFEQLSKECEEFRLFTASLENASPSEEPTPAEPIIPTEVSALDEAKGEGFEVN